MAKKSVKQAVTTVVTKVRAGIDRVVTAFDDAFTQVQDNATVLDNVLNVSNTVFKTSPPTEDELKKIADDLAVLRGWDAVTSGRMRKSEVRKIVRNYSTLPEAMKIYRKKHGHCAFHTAIKLCTILNAGKKPAAAVKAVAEKTSKKETKKLTPKAATKKNFIALVNTDRIDPSLKQALIRLAAKHGVSLS